MIQFNFKLAFLKLAFFALPVSLQIIDLLGWSQNIFR